MNEHKQTVNEFNRLTQIAPHRSQKYIKSISQRLELNSMDILFTYHYIFDHGLFNQSICDRFCSKHGASIGDTLRLNNDRLHKS